MVFSVLRMVRRFVDFILLLSKIVITRFFILSLGMAYKFKDGFFFRSLTFGGGVIFSWSLVSSISRFFVIVWVRVRLICVSWLITRLRIYGRTILFNLKLKLSIIWRCLNGV